MTIANAAVLIGLAEFALAVTAPQPVFAYESSSSAPPGPCADGLSSAQCLPTFYSVSCFDLVELADRDACLQTELEDQAIAYSTGLEVYHRPTPLHRGREAIDALPRYKTVWPRPFECHGR